MVSFEIPYPLQPSFQDVLDNIAPEPFTLSAFKHFLIQRHAIESLQFLLCFRHYATLYSLSAPGPESATTEHPQREALSTLWQNLVSHYIIPGSRNEINITTQQRHALLAHHHPTPHPSVLEQTVQQIAEALRISVFAEFVNSVDMQIRKYRVYTRSASMPAAPTLSYLAATSTDPEAVIPVKRSAWFRWPYRRKYSISIDQDSGKWKRKAKTVVGLLHI